MNGKPLLPHVLLEGDRVEALHAVVDEGEHGCARLEAELREERVVGLETPITYYHIIYFYLESET